MALLMVWRWLPSFSYCIQMTTLRGRKGNIPVLYPSFKTAKTFPEVPEQTSHSHWPELYHAVLSKLPAAQEDQDSQDWLKRNKIRLLKGPVFPVPPNKEHRHLEESEPNCFWDRRSMESQLSWKLTVAAASASRKGDISGRRWKEKPFWIFTLNLWGSFSCLVSQIINVALDTHQTPKSYFTTLPVYPSSTITEWNVRINFF